MLGTLLRALEMHFHRRPPLPPNPPGPRVTPNALLNLPSVQSWHLSSGRLSICIGSSRTAESRQLVPARESPLSTSPPNCFPSEDTVPTGAGKPRHVGGPAVQAGDLHHVKDMPREAGHTYDPLPSEETEVTLSGRPFPNLLLNPFSV